VVDGENLSYEFAVASFANGRFTNITPKEDQSWFPGGVAWSNKLNITNVADRGGGDVIHISVSGRLRGETLLPCPSCSIVSIAIFWNTLAATAAGSGVVCLFEYPGRGRPPPRCIITGLSEPFGIAMSYAITE
jgi:hypothetical protein